MSLEEIRQEYRPEKIRVLFVGESPPAGGTFFYNADSGLLRYTREAFRQVYGPVCGEGCDFLRFFQARGCFLDDLCREPVNHLTAAERKQACRDAVVPFAERLRVAKPQALVVVVKRVLSCVESAVQRAQLEECPLYSLPHPSRGNQSRFITELTDVLNALNASGILRLSTSDTVAG